MLSHHHTPVALFLQETISVKTILHALSASISIYARYLYTYNIPGWVSGAVTLEKPIRDRNARVNSNEFAMGTRTAIVSKRAQKIDVA